jgi:hypothetical protein
MYLFVGSMIPFADASNMIALGAPRWLLFLFGVPLLGGFVVVLTSAIQFVVFCPTESLWKRIIVVELGLLTFPALMVGSMFFMPVPQSVRLPTITFVTCYAVCFCIAAYRVRAPVTTRDSDVESTSMNQNWFNLFALILSAVVLVVVEWLAFGAK